MNTFVLYFFKTLCYHTIILQLNVYDLELLWLRLLYLNSVC
jgi:hypothetical protein